MTALLVFRECPYKFKCKYLDRVSPGKPRLLNLAAGVFHRYFREWARRVVLGIDPETDELIEQVKESWRSRIKEVMGVLDDDYAPSAMAAMLRESFQRTVNFIVREIQMDIEDAGRTVEVGFPGRSGIVLKHELPLTGFTNDGERSVFRVRFGPATPQPSSDYFHASADIWIGRRFYSPAPRMVILYFPWRQAHRRVIPDETMIGRWRSETVLLLEKILERMKRGKPFEPHPGVRCLNCEYVEECQEQRGSDSDAKVSLISEPHVRAAYRFVDVTRMLRRLKTEQAELAAYLADWMNRHETNVMKGVGGEDLLLKEIHYRLPRRGSNSRKKLTELLNRYGFGDKMTVRNIVSWLKKSELDPAEAQAIRDLLAGADRLRIAESTTRANPMSKHHRSR